MNGEERWQSAGSLERFNAGEMFAGSVDGYLHLSNGKWEKFLFLVRYTESMWPAGV